MEQDASYNKLWERLRHGNEEALYLLYKAFYQRLHSAGVAICREPESVKDAINQTFLYFWEKHETLGKAENVSGYIFTSFRRQLLADLTSQRKNIQKLEKWSMEKTDETPPYEEYLVEIQNREEMKELISMAINKLSKRKQALIRMHYYEGLSYEEIAAKTGLTLRTIYNKLHEAIKSLRTDLQAGNKGKSLPVSLWLFFYFF